MRNLLVCAAVLLCAASLFASTPTGTVILSWSPGACPQASFNQFAAPSLDSSGNYTANWGINLQPGQYCVQAAYQGDDNFGASQTTFTMRVIDGSTTSLVVIPSPSSSGQPLVVSGTVSPQ